jgi:uncharacterized membrane protein YphA (DoxX/SURF4 family)
MSAGSTTPPRVKSGKAKTITVWVVTALLACLFVLAGVMKFVNPEMAEHFAQWGYPNWFHLLIGTVEVAGALALLVPRTAFYAAAALGVVMVGAVATHLRHGETPQAVVPFVLLVLLALVAYTRRPRLAT